MFRAKKKIPQFVGIGILVLAIIAYALGANLDLMEIDAAQYGSISLEMLQNKSFLEITYNGNDYLDKPPLLFWLASLSFYLFGIHDVAYKLPSILSTFLAAYSIFQLGKLYYGKQVGLYSAIIYLTLQSTFLINHDVRTDTLLSGFVIYSIWQIAGYFRLKKNRFLYGAGLGIGLAMLAKGPIGLMVPALALGNEVLFKRKWKEFLNPHILGALLLVAILIFPMAYGLYHQFDLHPEKIVNNKQGVSGLYFYFWEQSFGRITGSNTWKDDSGPFFFVGTWLWSFMPWILFGALGLVNRIKKVVTHQRLAEYFTLGGIILPFIALSMSQYKLPHYIYVTFPLWAIVAGYHLAYYNDKWKKYAQMVILFLYIPIGLFLFYVFEPERNFLLLIILIAISLIIYTIIQRDLRHKLLMLSALVSITFNIILNGHFYPHLFEYQSNTQIIEYLRDQEVDPSSVTFLDVYPFGLRYWYQKPVQIMNSDQSPLDQIETPWIVVSENSLNKVLAAYPEMEIFKKFKNFRISKLTSKFLNPNTREEAINFAYLLKTK